jgi:5'-3' exonuclease
MKLSESGPAARVQVHLVDGTFELFRAFYGAPSAQTADGREVGATRALLRSIRRLLAEPGVSHVAVAFDQTIESFRNDLFGGYKTGDGIDPALFSQFDIAERAIAAFGVVTWPMVEFEADDALATAATRFAPHEHVERVVICTPDKDLAQCVRDRDVVLYDRIRRRELDEDGVRAKFGVSPASIPDYLALVGDSADGIPGVPRWGAKSAASVLSHYQHIERIPTKVEEWEIQVRGAKALAENLNSNLEAALLYRRLATLRCDVPLEEDLDALRYRGPDGAQLQQVCDTLADQRFFDSVVKEGAR